jgi:hypothetical protein
VRLALALLCCTPACAVAQAGSQAAPAGAVRFTRQEAPFVVTGQDGTAMAQPFLGGLDVPRPQLVDIDGDGDLDLFLQERSGEIAFFERDAGRWTWRTDRFHDLDVGEWYRFVDLDADGDWDVLGESRFSYIKAWRNTGTRTAPAFTLAADSLRTAGGAPLFADRQNILNLVDIDCNGRLDLFLGRVTGTVDRFEAEPGLGPDGLPRFRLLTERWEGIEIIGPTPGGANPVPGTSTIPNGSRHGANTMAFGDIDGDGDADLFWGDFFEEGVLLIPNLGGCPHFSLRSTPERFPHEDPVLTTGYNAPAPGDVDGDGDLDLVIGVIGGAFSPARSGVENLYLIEQTGPGAFRTATSRLLPMVDVGSESVPMLADLDGDGDLDLLVGNKIAPNDNRTATITHFENVGSATAPAFQDRGELAIRGEFHASPTPADLDGDGLLDLVLGTWRDRVQWWRNTGSRTAPAWTLADSALVVISRGSNTTPALGDLDGDGDLDMLIGEASGQVNLYRNTGSRTAPAFELVSDEFQGIDPGRRSAPHLMDLDGDGKLDIVLGSEDGEMQLWRNVGTGAEIRFERVTGFAVASDAYAAPTSGDLDGDGVVDLVVGTVSGGLRYFRGGR